MCSTNSSGVPYITNIQNGQIARFIESNTIPRLRRFTTNVFDDDGSGGYGGSTNVFDGDGDDDDDDDDTDSSSLEEVIAKSSSKMALESFVIATSLT